MTRRFDILSGDAKCSARHPLDLRGLAPGSKFKILFHYTSELGVANITNAKAKDVDWVCSSLIRSSIERRRKRFCNYVGTVWISACNFFYPYVHTSVFAFFQAVSSQKFSSQSCASCRRMHRSEVELLASLQDKFSHFGQGPFHSIEYAETQKQRHCESTFCVMD